MGNKEQFSGLVLTGPCAGQFHTCSMPFLRLADPVSSVKALENHLYPGIEKFKVRTYHWFPVEVRNSDPRVRDLSAGVWVPEGWEFADVIRELMEGYKRP